MKSNMSIDLVVISIREFYVQRGWVLFLFLFCFLFIKGQEM